MISMFFLVLIHSGPSGTAMIQMPLPYTEKACELAGNTATVSEAMSRGENQRGQMSYACVPTPTNAANAMKDLPTP
jgi:hypothetical protein